MEILTLPNPLLRKKAEAVEKVDKEILKIIKKMKVILEPQKEPLGVGLAAPQIGVGLRICVVRVLDTHDTCDTHDTHDTFKVFINPKITFFSEEKTLELEGCLSVPNKFGLVPRAKEIKFQALNEKGEKVAFVISDFLARVIQHEVDHLEGTLFIDKVIGNVVSGEELQ